MFITHYIQHAQIQICNLNKLEIKKGNYNAALFVNR
jgi:hypothetical protein